MEAQPNQRLSSKRRAISERQRSMAESLRRLNPLSRFSLGLIICAILAYYIPMVLVALTGAWVNNLLMWNELAVGVAMLLAQNLIGNKVGRPMLVAIIFAVLIDCYYVQFFARISMPAAWKGAWKLFFVPTVGFPLNAYLLIRYKQLAGL